MANTFLTISEITYRAAMVLKNTPRFATRCNRQYDGQFAQSGAKVGATINIRKPWRPVGRTGFTAKFEGINETYVPLTLDKPFGVDMNFTTADLTLSMDDFDRRYITPAVIKIANYIDEVGMQLYAQFPWMVGTPGGGAPSSMLTYYRAGAILSEEGFPRDNFQDMRTALLNPESMAVIANANTALFNPQGTISEQYRTALMSQAGGMAWFEDENTVVHTVGALGGTPLVNGAGQTGNSLSTDGWSNSVTGLLNVGDVFTIAGVYAVNPQNRASTGRLRQFRVTAVANSNGSGQSTLAISPAIIPPDSSGNPVQFQTVTTSPADNAALTVTGTAGAASPQNLLFYRDAVVLAMVDLELPPAIPDNAKERVSDPESGVSIRLYQYQDGVNDVAGARLDVLFGYCVVYETGGVRVAA